VGAAVGDLVGAAVGDLVGAAVGDLVLLFFLGDLFLDDGEEYFDGEELGERNIPSTSASAPVSALNEPLVDFFDPLDPDEDPEVDFFDPLDPDEDEDDFESFSDLAPFGKHLSRFGE
jgi:hypothetical protein